jgi:hypothetical protein
MILFSISPLGEFHNSASSLCSFDLLVSCPCCCDLVCASGHCGKMWKHLIPFQPQNVESWLFYISYTILVWCSLLSKFLECMNVAIGFYQRFILSHMYLFGRWWSDALWGTLLRVWLHSLTHYVIVGTQVLSHWPGSWSLINFCVFWGYSTYSTKLLSLRVFFHWQGPCRMQVLFCQWFLKQHALKVYVVSRFLFYFLVGSNFRVFPIFCSYFFFALFLMSFHLLYS